MDIKAIKAKLKNGIGSTIIGSGIMLLALLVTIAAAQSFITQVYAHQAQTAADSIADGVAAYMADNGGDYNDAVKQSKKLKKYIQDETGYTLRDITLDEDDFDEHKITATVTVDGYHLIEMDSGDSTFSVTRSTTTEYKCIYGELVQWMIDFAADDTHGYDMGNRTASPDVDCSSFVYYGLLNTGYTVADIGGGPFTTATMGEILKKAGFKEYAYSSVPGGLQTGDIMVYKQGFLGHAYGHTEVYVGDGYNVGAHSNYNGVAGDGSGKEVSVSSNHLVWQYVYRR